MSFDFLCLFVDSDFPAKDDAMTSEEAWGAMTLSDYMTLARELQACCRHMTKVKGAQKLERRIGTEIKFFQSVSHF